MLYSSVLIKAPFVAQLSITAGPPVRLNRFLFHIRQNAQTNRTPSLNHAKNWILFISTCAATSFAFEPPSTRLTS